MTEVPLSLAEAVEIATLLTVVTGFWFGIAQMRLAGPGWLSRPRGIAPG